MPEIQKCEDAYFYGKEEVAEAVVRVPSYNFPKQVLHSEYITLHGRYLHVSPFFPLTYNRCAESVG